MAVSETGPFFVVSPFPAAPVPRPPQPTRAIWMVPLSAPWTCGRATPARAETAASLPVFLMKVRREVGGVSDSFIKCLLNHVPDGGATVSIQEVCRAGPRARRESVALQRAAGILPADERDRVSKPWRDRRRRLCRQDAGSTFY